MSRLSRPTGVFAVIFVLLALAACGGGRGRRRAERATTTRSWSGPATRCPTGWPPTQAIIAKFTAKTGIQVELVGVDEDQFNQLLTSAAAAGELPDVIGSQPLAAVRTLAANELVNTDATAAVVRGARRGHLLGQRALELTRDGDTQLAVPSDAWAQLLYYRKDLFDAAGCAAPTTYDDITAAARRRWTSPRSGRLRRRHHARRRVHPADLRAPRAGQRLRDGRRGGRDHHRQLRSASARSTSTAT